MRGEWGDDLIVGEDGNDVLDGGAGADTMDGGAGNDIYYVSEAADQVIETGGGRDKVYADIDYALGDTVEDLWLTKGRGAVTATGNAANNMLVGNEIGNLVTGHGGRDALFGMNGDDTLEGGAGDDRLYAGHGNDVLRGGGGRDKLYGQAGSNLLEGGAGNDNIAAGSGGDVLNGGVGSDLLGGGAGADVFLFTAGDGADTVKHFELGVDRLDLRAIDLASVEVTTSDWGVTVRYGASDSVVLRDVASDTPIGVSEDLLLV